MNLVLNGMEAIAPLGDGPRELVIRSGKDGPDQVTVAVQDSGVGIDPDSEKQLFNPFFTTKPHGTGMGLSICRSIIELHGGRVWASRNARRGATFHVLLALASGRPLGAVGRSRNPEGNLSIATFVYAPSLYEWTSGG